MRSMATVSGSGPPFSRRTLPETNTGWIVASGAVLVREGVVVLDVVFVFPVELRCAVAARGNAAMPIQSQALKREEPKIIEPSIKATFWKLPASEECYPFLGWLAVKKSHPGPDGKIS